MRRSRKNAATVTALLAVSGALACGKGSVIDPRTPTLIEIVGGANQTGAVGLALTGKIVVRASDAQGPLPGVILSSATDPQVGGSAAPAMVTTGTDGTAQTTWTLGTRLGIQTLTFATTGVAPVSVNATATAGIAAVITPLSDGFQSIVVGHAVPVLPSVRVTDPFGNPLPGVPVSFEAIQGLSTLTGSSPQTDAQGVATLGSWSIGQDAITYVVRALISGGASTNFQAQGIPATVSIVEGNGQSVNAGTAVPVLPAIRAARDDGSALPNVAVAWAVTLGGGTVQGGSTLTGNDGIARPAQWILGVAPGPNALEARVIGKNALTFQATGITGVAASATATSPVSQAGFFGNFVRSTPTITVKDAQGNPIAGAPVTFQLVLGDGQLTGTAQTTGFDGSARLNSWRLGNAVSSTVQATAGAFAPVQFTASASAAPASSFTIDVRFLPTSSPTAAQTAAFTQAAARWKQIIISGDAPYPVNETATSCYPAINETVPGVVIFVDLKPIDGVNGILGQAGPCIVRDDPGYLAAVGTMQFDTADLAAIEANGRLNDVILHEMGHVLGFGTMWTFLTNALLTGAGSSNPFFNGTSARGAFLAAAAVGTTFTGTPVPVENTGGGGTRDSHWREATVTNELMTGFISSNVNPLSAFTAASLRDLGYVVNDAAADPFTFQAFLQGAPAVSFELREGQLTDPILVINRRGERVARVPRK